MDPAEVTKKDLFKACESLFGTDIDASVDFLRYLKPDGVKAAYRKRALETHPDRARVVPENRVFWKNASRKSTLPTSFCSHF